MYYVIVAIVGSMLIKSLDKLLKPSSDLGYIYWKVYVESKGFN